MKEAQDLLTALRSTIDETTNDMEALDKFTGKEEMLVLLDTIYNDVSYALGTLSS